MREAKFKEHVREKEADLKKKMDVIASANRKLDEMKQKLRDMGALAADSINLKEIKVDHLTAEEKLVATPLAEMCLKYLKLNHSLSCDHDIKKCELDIEIAKFHTTALDENATVLIQKIDNKMEMLLTEGGRDVERDEEQVRVYQDDLVKVLHEINETNSRCALLEKRLLELAEERRPGEGMALVPVAKKIDWDFLPGDAGDPPLRTRVI